MRSIEFLMASNRSQEPTLRYQSRLTHRKLLSYTFAGPDGVTPGIDLDEERRVSKEPPWE